MQFTNGTEKPMEFNLTHLFSIVSVFPTLSAFKGFSECSVTAELPLRMARLNLPTANISRIWANQARFKNIHLLFGTVF